MLQHPVYLAAVEAWVYGRGVIAWDVPIFAVPTRHMMAIVEFVIRRSEEGGDHMTELWDDEVAKQRREQIVEETPEEQVARFHQFAMRNGG